MVDDADRAGTRVRSRPKPAATIGYGKNRKFRQRRRAAAERAAKG